MDSDGTPESQFTSGYAHGAPWRFKGRALFQLHLVKAETARKLIPRELKLVEAFGYTLGGLFLARYDASPAGAFDELVAISGIVWNPPTSCAWASRVLVSSYEAREHGRKEVGLPSHLAEFRKSTTGAATLVNEVGDDGAANPLCSISLPVDVLEAGDGKEWRGPKINFSLPSYRTAHNPQLLKYSCRMKCRVRPVKAARVTEALEERGGERREESVDSVSEVLQSKPLLAVEFSSLEMVVGAPSVVPPRPPA
ncbi:protein NEOXANTHIN-DEFICIENT 1 isoform X2 [Wolffia australiana]